MMSWFCSPVVMKGLQSAEMVYQGEVSECGLACITMLLQTLGHNVSLQELRSHYGASLQGMSLADLRKICADYGVETDPVHFDKEALKALPLPAILHVGSDHFIVVRSAGGDLFHICDPASGSHVVHCGILTGMATGYALIPGESVTPVHKKPQVNRLSRSRWNWICEAGGSWLVLLTLFNAAFAFITPLFVGMAVNALLGHARPGIHWQTGGVWLLATAGAFAFERFSGQVLLRHCAIEGMRSASRGFSRLLSNPLRYFTRRTPGDIVERFTAFTAISLAGLQLRNTLLISVIVAVVSVVVMAWLAPWLAVVSLTGIAVAGLITGRFLGRMQNLRYQTEQVASAQQQFLLESIQGIVSLKSARVTDRRIHFYNDHCHDMVRVWRQRAELDLKQRTAYALLAGVELWILLNVAAAAIHSGHLSLGGFYAFSFLNQITFTSATTGLNAWLSLRANRVTEVRARDLFEQAQDERINTPPRLQRGLVLEEVCFQYEREGFELRNIRLSISCGEKIAILGPSGCGKTTLMTLLCGLESPQSGSLTVDGDAVSDWRMLRHYCYLQSSSDVLFSGTVLDNISLFTAAADRSRCRKLLDEVGLTGRISDFAQGIDTPLTETTASLSAGERQRLMVARALYADRDVGIFDEPTANLDPLSTRQVISAITSSAQAAVVVTHDASQLHLFDIVYVLSEGRLTRQQIQPPVGGSN